MEELIELYLIDPNPWQAREAEDRAHVWEIAQSISEHGMMQTPAGRRVNGRVQLAFGNTRLAAYRLLDEQSKEKTWSRMPVNILDITDEDMFRRGIEENVARKNLTPLEEALAMVRYRDEFGKTSEEIGKLFHMGDSGVRNKIRLLRLPEDIKMLLRRGDMPEGVARELLALVELPEDVRMAAEDDDSFVKPSEIIEAAKSGSSQKAIAELVSKFMVRIGQRKEMPAPAPEPPALATFQPSRPAEDAPAREQLAWQRPEPAKEAARVFEQAVPAAETLPSQVDSVSVETVNPATGEMLASESEQPAEPAQIETWETAEITVTLTWWPYDENPDGRLIMAGAAAKGHAQPVFRMYRDGTIQMGDDLRDLLDELRNKYFNTGELFGGAS